MNTALEFNFTVDTTNHTVFITREFAAGLSLAWDAFTNPSDFRPVGGSGPVDNQDKIHEIRNGWTQALFDVRPGRPGTLVIPGIYFHQPYTPFYNADKLLRQ